MPTERVERYNKTVQLRFCDEQIEQAFQNYQATRGRSTSVYALFSLFALSLAFAFLEYRILGLNSLIPMVAYLIVAGLSFVGGFFSLMSQTSVMLKLRILVPGMITFGVLLSAVYLHQYRIYHSAEFALIIIWLGTLNILTFRLVAITLFIVISAFSGFAYIHGATELKLTGLLTLEASAFFIAIYLSYLLERLRRTLFLTNVALKVVNTRQEGWAYTLIDMDMALSGIHDFKALIARVVEFIKPVIDYDSYVFMSMDGKLNKLSPEQMDGTLFKDEDKTLWPDDLISKLSQTRQASISAEYEMEKKFLGREKKNFLHFRIDIPVFDDSSLVGIISLRRRSGPFDSFDLTASVSLVTQAMIFFKRTKKAVQASKEMLIIKKMEEDKPRDEPDTKKQSLADKPPLKQEDSNEIEQDDSPTTYDLEVTDESGIDKMQKVKKTSQGRDETIIPKAVIDKLNKDKEKAKKTITLLSRENADQVAIDRYRTAAVEAEPLSILLIEVDGLSSIREKDGDQTAYKIFSGIVKNIFSKTDKKKDILGRYGQNGLSILLPRVDMNAAEKFGDSIRQQAENLRFKTAYGERSATLSVGVAAITDETGNYDSMVKRADMALFVAKKNGRNCVKVRL